MTIQSLTDNIHQVEMYRKQYLIMREILLDKGIDPDILLMDELAYQEIKAIAQKEIIDNR